MIIREELPSDIEAIRKVNFDAFEITAEADLVDALRASGCTYISLVAELKSRVLGHIAFTPVALSGRNGDVSLFGLSPMAVLRQYQNSGIGSRLVQAGLEYCLSRGCDAVVVLGHPGFYPRFGFVPSVRYGIKSEYKVPDDVFMIVELTPGSLGQQEGIVRYNEAFATL